MDERPLPKSVDTGRLVHGIDISSHQPNYLGRIFDQYKPQHVVVKLYLPVEQGLWPVTVAQAGSARALGATVGGYVWGYRSVDPRRTARDAIGIATTAGIHPLPVLWLDCETYGEGDEFDPGPDAPWLRAFFDECGKFKQRAGIYCVSAESRVLTKDLRWIPAGDLKVGDGLFAFDEHAGDYGLRAGRRAPRHLTESAVVLHEPKMADLYDIVLSDGQRLRCTLEHPWLVRRRTELGLGGSGLLWTTTEEIRDAVGRGRRVVLPRFMQPWTDDRSYEGGFLAAAFAGEGSYYRHPGGSGRLSFAQKPNGFADRVEEALKARGFSFNRSPVSTSNGCVQIRINGGYNADMRFLGSIRPPRLLENWTAAKARTQELRSIQDTVVEAVEPAGRGEIASMQTSSATFFAEGFGAHNTGRWWVKQYFPGGEAAFAEFSKYPLWLADYDGDPDITVWWPFSGFEQLAGKQYNVDKIIYQNGLDLDVFRYAYTVPEDS